VEAAIDFEVDHHDTAARPAHSAKARGDFAETFRFLNVSRRGRLRELFAEFGPNAKGVPVFEKFLVLHDYIRSLEDGAELRMRRGVDYIGVGVGAIIVGRSRAVVARPPRPEGEERARCGVPGARWSWVSGWPMR